MIVAHPTTYAGQRFRSRLEARWAAFFDLAKMHWQYEPIDFDGWAPDFLLQTTICPVYAEVKPVALKLSQYGDHRSLPDDPSFAKAHAHRNNVQVLLLGLGPEHPSNFFGIGSLLDPPDWPAERRYSWMDVKEQLTVEDGDALWRQAGNVVQWRAR